METDVKNINKSPAILAINNDGPKILNIVPI